MLIYLYGPDSYRRYEKQKEIIFKYKEKHAAVNVDRFLLDAENELERLKEFLKNQSLFENFKLAVIQLSKTANEKELAELFKKYIEAKTITLLITADEKLPSSFSFLTKKPALSQEFKELTGVQLTNFIKSEAAKRKLNLSSQDITKLVQVHGSNLWGLVNDLDKLALGGALEDRVSVGNIFPYLTRAKRGDLSALEFLLAVEEPAKIFNIMAAQADTYLKNKMADYDAAIKSGKLGYAEALIDLTLG